MKPPGGIRLVRLIARLNVGGPAQHVVWLTGGLSRRGYETVLGAGRVGPDEKEFVRILESQGVRPHRIPGLGRAIRPLDDLVAWIEIVRLLARTRPRIVHTHTAKAGALGRLAVVARTICGAPRPIVVHTYHGHVFEGYFGPCGALLYRLAERLLARVSDVLIVLSPAQKHDLVDRFRIAPADRFRIVPLGIDLEPFLSLPARRRRADAPPRIGWIGRLAPVKAPERLLEVAHRFPEARYQIAGEGARRAELARAIEAEGLGGVVELLGPVDDVPAFLAEIDLLALTSINEGTPVGILEAFAAGVPVVAPAVGGIPDLLAEGRGTLVPPDDPDALAHALRQLAHDPARAQEIARRARAYVRDQHGLEALLSRVETLYREVELARRVKEIRPTV